MNQNGPCWSRMIGTLGAVTLFSLLLWMFTFFSIMKWKKETPEIWSTEAEGGECCFLLDRYAQNGQAAAFSTPRQSPSVVKCWDHPTGANRAGGAARGGADSYAVSQDFIYSHGKLITNEASHVWSLGFECTCVYFKKCGYLCAEYSTEAW